MKSLMIIQNPIQFKDFVMVPRKIRDAYSRSELTLNEFLVLLWTWLNTNPVNGMFSTSYPGLVQDLRGAFSEDNARKIVCSLRKKGWIFYFSRRGRRGSFNIFPLDYPLSSGKVQTLDYLKAKFPPKQSQSSGTHHNSVTTRKAQITTSEGDNEFK